jgi:hypothetical protein
MLERDSIISEELRRASILIVDSTIPPHMTLHEWRRLLAARSGGRVGARRWRRAGRRA